MLLKKTKRSVLFFYLSYTSLHQLVSWQLVIVNITCTEVLHRLLGRSAGEQRFWCSNTNRHPCVCEGQVNLPHHPSRPARMSLFLFCYSLGLCRNSDHEAKDSIVYSYTKSFNAFAARLSNDEAEKLKSE